MIKELEAFRDILGILSAVSGCEVDMNSERVKIVNQALQRLESIDNAKPSEAMECLNKVYIYLSDAYDYKEIKEEVRNDIETVKQALLKAQKLENENSVLKACIKDWEDDMAHIEYALEKSKKENAEYKKVLEIIKGKLIWVENDKLMCGIYGDTEIELEEIEFENEEEFNLLKRYFK